MKKKYFLYFRNKIIGIHDKSCKSIERRAISSTSLHAFNQSLILKKILLTLYLRLFNYEW